MGTMKLHEMPTDELCRALDATRRVAGPEAIETRILARELGRRERLAARAAEPAEDHAKAGGQANEGQEGRP